MTDDDGYPIAKTRYIAFLEDGNTVEGVTDEEGFTNSINTVQKTNVAIHLFLENKLEVK